MGAAAEILEPFDETFHAPADTDQIDGLLGEYQAMRRQVEHLANLMEREGQEVLSLFIEGNISDHRYRYAMPTADKLFKAEGAIAALNARYWDKALRLTDVLECMPQSRRSDWHEQIRNHDTPDFEETTVRDTLVSMLSSRSTYFAERVEGIFRRLSHAHVTNRPEGFSKRMIVNGALNDFGSCDVTTAGYINDLRCVLAQFMGREAPSSYSAMRILDVGAKRLGEWLTIDGGALRIKLFKKGTAHLEVHPEMAWRLNAVLAYLHPHAIPTQFRAKPKQAPKSFAVLQTPLPTGVVKTIVDILGNNLYIDEQTVCLPYTGMDTKGEKEAVQRVLGSLGGASSDGRHYEFDYDPRAVLEDVVVSGILPEDKSHQFYHTKETLAELAIDHAAIGDADECLEPSAGIAGLAKRMPKDRTQCVEISPLRCKVLEGMGFQVECDDFLAWAERTTRLFDRVILNPPYADGRALLHLRAASEVTRAGGRIVAILPASMKGKEPLAGFDHVWEGPFEDQFDGTGVRVALLIADKR